MKVKKILKRTLFFFIGLILLIVIAAVAIPYFFKDEIVQAVKTQVNENINAEVDFDNNISLSLLRSFPDFSLGIKDLTVMGKGEFEGLRLAKIGQLNLKLDLMSVIKSDRPVAIESVRIDDANIYVKVTADGKANYDLSLPPDPKAKQSTSSGSSEFDIRLSDYGITNSDIVYDDDLTSTYLEVLNLNHTGKGNFNNDIYDLGTRTSADALTVSSMGVSYINKSELEADITLNIDNKKSKYTFKDNALRLNALKLDLDGWLEMPDENMKMDLKFKAPSTDFKHLLSMIPSAYTKDFDQVKASGKMALNGSVKGTLSDKSLPAFKANLSVDNGKFKYPDLPMGIEDIQTKIKVNSPSSDLDKMMVDVPKFHMKLGKNPFDAVFNLTRPISDPNVKAKVNGKIDLADLAKAFPMEGVKKLNGLLDANLDINTRMSYVENEQYDKVDMKGDFKISNMNYVAEGTPKVHLKNMAMAFSPKHVNLSSFDAKLGRSDIKASGTLDNILAYFSPELTMRGKLKVNSFLFDANEWMSETSADDPTADYNPSNTTTSTETEVFDRFNFDLDAKFTKIIYEDYELINTTAKGNFTPEKVVLSNMSTRLGKSDIQLSGELDNVFDYLLENETITGKIKLKSNRIDLNELLASEETTTTTKSTSSSETTASSGAVAVPDNMDVLVTASIDELLYDDLVFRKMNSQVAVKDERAAINNFTANGFGGQFDLKGFYDSKDISKPAFNLEYDLDRMNVKKIFTDLASVKQLAPVMEFIEGMFNTRLALKGNLTPDMGIDYTSLTGGGSLETIDAVINNFKPLANIGEKLKVKSFKRVELTDTKNLFDIKDGMFQLKPADYTMNKMDVNISGSHGLVNQAMDYLLKFNVPKEILAQGALGNVANQGLSFFNGQAGKLGINIADGDRIKFNVRVTGDMKNPKIKIDLIGTDKESLKEEIVDKVKDVAKDKADEKATEIIKNQTGLEGENVKDIANEAKDKAIDAGKEKVDEVLGGVKDKVGEEVGGKVEEVFGEKAKDKVDALKDKIKLPFGKKNKKKNGGNE